MSALALDPTVATMAMRDIGANPKVAATAARAREQSQEFEAVFMSTMFQSMFTSIQGDGPMGSTTGVAPWRSFLTQEYAKSFVKNGGIGLADHVYRSLIAQQAARSKTAPADIATTPTRTPTRTP